MRTLLLLLLLCTPCAAELRHMRQPEPTPEHSLLITKGVPQAGANLSEWEDYTKDAWVKHRNVEWVQARNRTLDGSFIDLTVRFNDDGKCKTRVWEVTRDWRRGVSKLGFLLQSTGADYAGLLLVDDNGTIDAAEVLRCQQACQRWQITLSVVDSKGKFR